MTDPVPSFTSLGDRAADALFRHRWVPIGLLLLLTFVFAAACSGLRIDAGFKKNLPLNHPFMETYHEHAEDFGGANKILLIVRANDDNAFARDPFIAASKLTESLGGLPGINQGDLTSIFTPNVFFIEDSNAKPVVPREDFFLNFPGQGNDWDPAKLQGQLDGVRANVIKAGVVGRLVSRDFSSFLIQASVLPFDPATGGEPDYLAIADKLEDLREQFRADFPVDVHIVGFAMGVKSVADGAAGVGLFFVIAILITLLLVWLFTRSVRLTLLPVVCSLIGVVWNLGIITLFGFGLDPMSLLIPFLIFAIGVSHGVQMVNGAGVRMRAGASRETASRNAFRALLIPGIVALISDTIGFAAIYLIPIQTIRELAILASIGVLVIIVTNLLLLPLLLSAFGPREAAKPSSGRRGFGSSLIHFAKPTPALITIGIAILLALVGWWESRKLPIGDLKPGVPELRQSARLNQDIALLNERFDIGTDVLNILVESEPGAMIEPDVVFLADDLLWELENLEGVQGSISIPKVMSRFLAAGMDSSVKWRTLIPNKLLLKEAQTWIPTSLGLHKGDGSMMNLMVFLKDHKAETIQRVINHARAYKAKHEETWSNAAFPTDIGLALGNIGVMAATNEVVDAAQFPIMLYVYAAIIILCLLLFRSIRATLCIVLPLLVVSLLGYAFMRWLDIGLKISTLPVIALGAGIGVDYGIYIYSSLRRHWTEGVPLVDAYRATLSETGVAVLVTGLTLALGVSTWMFSALKFQADMGLMLAFLFLGNMIGALVVLPALARVLHRKRA